MDAPLHEHDRVELTAPAGGWPAGTRGTIVSLGETGAMIVVEGSAGPENASSPVVTAPLDLLRRRGSAPGPRDPAGREPQGHFLGVPYDFRRPTLERIRRRVWDSDDPRAIVPRAFGWGYDVNWATVVRRARRRR